MGAPLWISFDLNPQYGPSTQGRTEGAHSNEMMMTSWKLGMRVSISLLWPSFPQFVHRPSTSTL